MCLIFGGISDAIVPVGPLLELWNMSSCTIYDYSMCVFYTKCTYISPIITAVLINFQSLANNVSSSQFLTAFEKFPIHYVIRSTAVILQNNLWTCVLAFSINRVLKTSCFTYCFCMIIYFSMSLWRVLIRIPSPSQFNMSLVVRKPVFGVSDQVPHKPGCTATEDG